MLAHVNHLRYWKSEHDEQSCEDASAANASSGVFAIADGVGTTLFSNIWARLLVNHFLGTPLLSANPFEVEWWLRQIQERYQQELPSPEGMPWNALQKAQSQGSYSTLAAVRVTRMAPSTMPLPAGVYASNPSAQSGDEATIAHATLMAFGDSCILVKRADAREVVSFPLEEASDFDRAPISLPSKLSLFNRYFQRCAVKQLELVPEDTLILATDAVARWIVSAGRGRFVDSQQAFQEVAAQTADSWPAFITACRERDEMVDDDSTALIITLHAEGSIKPDGAEGGTPLGFTVEHTPAVCERRKRDFARAVEEQNKELIAIHYGDGEDLRREGVEFPADQLQQARAVADALRDMLQVLRREVNSPNAVEKLTPAWQQYASLLKDEPCAAKLRQTLTRLGVPLAPQNDEAAITSHLGAQETLHPGDAHQPQAAEVPDARELLKRRREQLELERRLMKALRLDDDRAIILAYDNIRQSPYGHAIPISPRREQRILLAQQRETERRRLRRALKSKNAEQIANAYDAVSRNTPLLSSDEHRQVLLASRFIEAYRTADDETLLATFEQISSFHEAIVLTSQEEERVAQARKHALSRQKPILVTAPVQTPAMHEEEFRKACIVKQMYLFYWVHRQITPEQLECMMFDDLVDDVLIQQGIEEANRSGASPLLRPDEQLMAMQKEFRNDFGDAYNAWLRKHELTEDSVKEVLLILLRHQLFEEYLLWQRETSLQDWLTMHLVERTAVRNSFIKASPWLSTLNWWKGD